MKFKSLQDWADYWEKECRIIENNWKPNERSGSSDSVYGNRRFEEQGRPPCVGSAH